MIVYLAWGSLFWNPDDLPINNWEKTDLILPLEFSRISDKGMGRLTLVIDEKNGTNNKVWYAESKIKNIDKSINALKIRENTIKDNIAYINLKTDKERVKNTPTKIVRRIKLWAKKNNIDVVIWTDLKSNWNDIIKSNYSVKDGYKYFLNSELDIKIDILKYIYKARTLTNINTKFSEYFFIKLNKK